jgi:two-component system LytT family response regulator
MPERIRVLVVDDERPARQRLVDLLHKDPRVGAISEAENGLIAVSMIEDNPPDLVFLDVQMPEMDGLSVIGAIGASKMPLTVFVTAYDQHAVRAFEANALDYLLKPFSDERHETTMARVWSRIHEINRDSFERGIAQWMSNTPIDRIVVKSSGTTRFLRTEEIDWIEATGVYVTLHTGAACILHRASLNDLAAKLDAQRFVRVHRSTIVNIESILHLEPISHGEFDVVLKHGARCRISRGFRAQLEKRLGQPL